MRLLFYPGMLNLAVVALLTFVAPVALFVLWENRDQGWVKALCGLALIALVVKVW